MVNQSGLETRKDNAVSEINDQGGAVGSARFPGLTGKKPN